MPVKRRNFTLRSAQRCFRGVAKEDACWSPTMSNIAPAGSRLGRDAGRANATPAGCAKPA